MAASYVIANATNPWTLSAPSWINNKQYQVTARAVDEPGNASPSNPTVAFVYDVNVPSSAISVPSVPFYPLGRPAVLTGTAQDWVTYPSTQAKSGLARVETLILDVNGSFAGQYWQGNGSWGAVNWRSVSTTTAGIAVWTYPPSSPAGDTIPSWEDGKQYTVQIRAADKTGNVESPAPSYSFTYDAQSPTMTVTSPSNGAFMATVSTFTGTKEETLSGIASVQVAVRDQIGRCWNATSRDFDIDCTGSLASNGWLASAVWTSTWSFYDSYLSAYFNNTVAAPNQFALYLAGYDSAGNVSRSTTSVADPNVSFTIDHFAPVSVTTYPASQYLLGGVPVTPIAGTANDQSNGAGITGLFSVKVKAMALDSAGTTWYWNALGSWVNTGDQGFNVQMGSLSGGTPGGTAASWTTDTTVLPASAFQEGLTYRVASQSRDLANPNNYEGATVSTKTFMIDASTPTAYIKTPGGTTVAYISTATLAAASGTVSEVTFTLGAPFNVLSIPSGVNGVDIELQDLSAAIPACGGSCQWWTSSAGWDDVNANSTATIFSSSWTYGSLPGDWTRGYASPDGRQYALRIRARDQAGNQGTFAGVKMSSIAIIFDGTRPNSTILAPALPGEDGSVVSSLSSISGTADDPRVNSSSSGVRSVFLTIQNDPSNPISDPNKGLYWNAGSNNWGAAAIWNPTAWDGTNWTFTSGAIDNNLRFDSAYIMISSAADNAGNAQLPPGTPPAPEYRRVIWQPPPAETGITVPQAFYYNQLPVLSGTANVNTTKVELKLKRFDTGECWGGGTTGFGWVDCLVQLSTATRTVYPSALSWSYPPPDETLPNWGAVNDTTFTLTSVGYNSAGQNESDKQVQFYVDRSSPISSVSFPGNNSYINAPPVLGGSTADPVIGQVAAGILNPGGVKIRLKRTDRASDDYWSVVSGTWTSITPSTVPYFSAGSSWTFTSSSPTLTWINGLTYTVEVFAEDSAQGGAKGNIEVPASPISFTLDMTPPLVNVTYPNNNIRHSTIPAIQGTAWVPSYGAFQNVQARVFQSAGLDRWANPANNLVFELTDPAQAEQAWFVAASTATPAWTQWFVSSGSIVWLNGSTYTIVARSLDMAGSYSVPYTTITFVYDSSAPTSYA
ncbi:MAG: hypothetical protein HY551_02475, partial [Elusimicrobia bacterium]|nr:hypothetical protein [Elusimicrobiota bacterium]